MKLIIGKPQDSTKLMQIPVDESKIKGLLQYSFDTHFVDAYSRESVKRKIKRVITEYEV